MENMKSLIDLVKERPLLYDEQEAQYKDTESRRLAWQEIASKIHLSADDCLDKWKSLRAQFRYHYKRDNFTEWKYAKDMAFLEQHIKWGRKSSSFNQSVSNDNDILEQNGHHNKTVANSPVSPRLRAKSST
ncbi:hypothetical protein BLA29_011879, partial [Euroglyphus maynei]